MDTFVSYIDFYKCFDVIDRNLLFFKLTEYGIDGKMYRTIKQMYSNTSSCVNVNGKLTEWFSTENGCRQGDVTSPTAFSILINGLLKELNSTGIGVKIDTSLIVSVLAFADDIVLLAESAEDLQKLVDVVHRWSSKWRFIINPEKSQIVHYRNAPKARTNFEFKIHDNGPILQVVDSYKYLGVYLDEYLTFSRTTQVLGTAGSRALGSMINKFKSLNDMGHTTYSKLYESLVTPIIDYGSAIWGFKNYDNIEKVQNRATRFFTGVHKYSPTLGHMGDMGWESNRNRWKIHSLRLWNRLVDMDNSRITKKIFNWDLNEHKGSNKSNFCAQVKQVMSEIGIKESYQRVEQVDLDLAKQQISDGSKQKWSKDIDNYAKLDLLKQIKPHFGTENYLKINIDRYDKSLLSQFRYGILPIELETGRYKGLDRAERLCTLCNSGQIEDQLHFAFHCPVYQDIRHDFVNACKGKGMNWENLTDINKVANLFEHHPRLFGKYITKIFVHRKSLLFK